MGGVPRIVCADEPHPANVAAVNLCRTAMAAANFASWPRPLRAALLHLPDVPGCDTSNCRSYASGGRHDEGLKVPIELKDYYAVAVEANGNLTLAHRADGQVLVFAPDHAFDGVTPVPGSPPYSLMTIEDAPDLPAWIDLCANAWAESLSCRFSLASHRAAKGFQ